ncbi:MAG: hypothetical protein UV65_C0021G0011 [Parcubacteria group bacterium GW2011_GWF2_43_11]|nr:MAG: hypothetical protein UV65_C0021G0011 [Parcubacteria group bacterium GW2011_GWF2_43_11]
MVTVTIPKKEYQRLAEKALRYEYLRQLLEEDVFASPPTKNIKEVMGEFKKTKIYGQNFLKSLEKGLGRSSHFATR